MGGDAASTLGEHDLVAVWSADAVEDALDRYEQQLSDRLNKPVTLRDAFREEVKAAYVQTPDDRAERKAALRADERDRYACPNCAETVEEFADSEIAVDLDPALRTKAHPVSLDGQGPEAVFGYEAADISDAAPGATQAIGPDEYAELCQEGVIESGVYRAIYCEDCDSVAYEIVGEGRAEMQDRYLEPQLLAGL